MVFHRVGNVLQQFYPTLTWHRDRSNKVIYLTFDDGPITGLTEEILDTLAAFQVRATFFCVGDNVAKHPYIFQKILSQGHAIGNHTQNHLKGWHVSDLTYFENTARCTETMLENGAQQVNLFRPPYGRIRRRQVNPIAKRYEIVMWDVLSGDYDRSLPANTCLRKTIQYSRPGSIVVFHDNVKATRNVTYALPRYIQHFQQRGYSFSTLSS